MTGTRDGARPLPADWCSCWRGRLARRAEAGAGDRGTLRTEKPLFTGLLVGAILIIPV